MSGLWPEGLDPYADRATTAVTWGGGAGKQESTAEADSEQPTTALLATASCSNYPEFGPPHPLPSLPTVH